MTSRLADARAYGEVPFGGCGTQIQYFAIPWDAKATVEVPGAGFHIAGYIDRLDVSPDGRRALVRDFKTGRAPKDDIVLDGGRELQRCLYAFAVKSMLGDDVAITASLLYPRNGLDLRLADPEATLRDIAGYLRAAHVPISSPGAALWDEIRVATMTTSPLPLPANAKAAYCTRKVAAATQRLGEAARIWEAT